MSVVIALLVTALVVNSAAIVRVKIGIEAHIAVWNNHQAVDPGTVLADGAQTFGNDGGVKPMGLGQIGSPASGRPVVRRGNRRCGRFYSFPNKDAAGNQGNDHEYQNRQPDRLRSKGFARMYFSVYLSPSFLRFM